MQEKSYVNKVYHLQYKVQDNPDATFSTQQPDMKKIYVNPNYPTKINEINLNSHVENKPMIYVNRKLLTQDISHHHYQEQFINTSSHMNNQITSEKKSLIHVNPKLMSKLIPKVPEQSSVICLQNNFQINDLLVEDKLIDIDSHKNKQKLDSLENLSKCDLDFLNSSGKNCQSLIAHHSSRNNKNPNGEVLLDNFQQSFTEDQQNLIKINTSQTENTLLLTLPLNTYKTSKIHGSSTDMIKRLLVSKEKQSSPSKNIKTNSVTMHACPRYNMRILRNHEKYNTKWHNKLSKNISMPSNVCLSKMKASCAAGLVSINGIVYKKNRNQLVRQSSNLLLKRNQYSSLSSITPSLNAKNSENESTGSHLQNKMDTTLKNNSAILLNKNSKTTISNKVKQKSLQILRNKMRKNNQPCLLFQKFGYCANQINDVCSKVHNKNQVALCKNAYQICEEKMQIHNRFRHVKSAAHC